MPRSPGPALLHEFFDARWAEWRDRPAVDIPPPAAGGARRVATYADLHRAARVLERRLSSLIAGPDSLVAVLLPRTTVAAFAAPIAVMRAGGAFTCLDPSFPDARVADLLQDAEPAAIVTDASGAGRLAGLGLASRPVVVIEDPVADIADAETPTDAPAAWLTPASLAYVIYTSGTTGRPKGVMIEHAAIANLVRSDLDAFGVGPGDRVSQNSSHAYDSSLEEVWLALAAGATLVVMDDDVARSGPDLVPWLEREAITVLCPTPTMLRATGLRDAAGLLPRLRLIYIGGEALTPDLVDIWAADRRFVNGYGPTETAVTSIRTDVAPGARVAIGRPVPNVTAWVLDDSLADVADGQTGELCLGGACLARGYWRDPDLTARKFPVHPRHGRIYRTGDLAVREPDGTLVCLGRADSQVKIRGYRIELEEIEARLRECDGVREAACVARGGPSRRTLAAFVVPADPGADLDRERIVRALRSVLPAYMVPATFHVVAALPTTTGGKLDRAALPEIAADEPDDAAPSDRPPGSELEARIEAALRRVAGRKAPVPMTADFFRDLGGDSLMAAQLITALRDDLATAGLTVRDAYEAPTIASLAARAGRAAPAAAVPRQRPDPGGRPGLATAVQVAWLAAEIILLSAAAYAVLAFLWSRLEPDATPGILVVWLPLLGLAGLLLYLPVSLAIAVLAKRLIVGRYRPGRWPVWGAFHVRHWAVGQLMRIVPWRLLDGTVFQAAALRALGARIGRRVHIHRGVDLLQGGWDLLEIGDDATIGQEAMVRLVDLEDEHLVVGAIRIGPGATIETRASLAGGSSLGAGGYLTALSSLPAGRSVPAGERWDGVPAGAAGRSPDPPPLDPSDRAWRPAFQGALMILSRLAGSLAGLTLAVVAFVWYAAATGLTNAVIAAWLALPFWRVEALAAVAIASALLVPLSVLSTAAAARALGPVRAGVISRWSPAYLRVWIKSDFVRRAGDWLSGTLMWPVWLRAAGMQVGRDCEISTIIDTVPELVSIGSGTFFADGVYLGCPRIHRGTVALERTRVGSEVFVGNHAVIPGGADVADGVLIGVSTVAGVETQRPGSSWFGHPPFALARPPAAPLDRRLTHDPSLIRYVNRWLWEVGRFLIPAASLFVLLAAACGLLQAQARVPAVWMAFGVTPALVAAAGVSLSTAVLALKWLLLGRVRPGRHPLWSCWCSRWDFLYVAWGRLARPFLSRFDGTLLLAWYLRAMGMRIGRRVVLGPGFAHVVDPDMLEIDDDATVHALFQAHTFEDRVLKIDRVRIGRRATVGAGAVLFYGADVGEGASVAAQSVIMKRERLSPHQRYEGCPSARVPHDR